MVKRIQVNRYQHNKHIKKLGYVLECYWCGRIFTNNRPKAYCSIPCKGKSNKTNKSIGTIFKQKFNSLKVNMCSFLDVGKCVNMANTYNFKSRKCPYKYENRKECKLFKPVYDIDKINDIKNGIQKTNSKVS